MSRMSDEKIDEVTNRWLEEESFRNLIHSFKQELIEVQRGARVVSAIPKSNQRKILYHHGVLYRGAKKGVPGLHGMLSPETLLVLEDIKGE